MKLDLIIISKLGLNDGGRETWFYNFLKELDKDSENLEITTVSAPIKDVNRIEYYKSKFIIDNTIEIDTGQRKVIPLSYKFVIKAALEVFKSNSRAPNVVAVGGVLELLTCFLSYPPIVYKGNKVAWLRTISHLEMGKESKILIDSLKFLEVLLLRYYFDKVLVNGKDAGHYYEKLGIKNEVINNGIPVDKWFQPVSQKKQSDELRIAFIGRLEKVKGIDNFINAIEYYFHKNHLKKIKFIIIGSGSAYKTISTRLDKFNIELYPSISNEDLPSVIANIDVCVALTLFSPTLGGCGLSNALLEQMCAGKLIIAWDNQIFRQILDESNSILIEQDNDIALSESFEFARKNYEDLTSLRTSAQIKSLNFTSKVNKDLFISKLDSLN